MNEYENEMEIMAMLNRIIAIREDLPGDKLLSAKLVNAAVEKRWDDVEKLLAAGADPRICRCCEAVSRESALYFALAGEKYELAGKLYDAGDRLDDTLSEVGNAEQLPPRTIEFLAREMHLGRNYFYDPSKTFSEHCRCSDFAQIEKLLLEADQSELDKGLARLLEEYLHNWRQSGIYETLLEKLVARGAKLAEENRKEWLATLKNVQDKWPRMMRPDEKVLSNMFAFARKS